MSKYRFYERCPLYCNNPHPHTPTNKCGTSMLSGIPVAYPWKMFLLESLNLLKIKLLDWSDGLILWIDFMDWSYGLILWIDLMDWSYRLILWYYELNIMIDFMEWIDSKSYYMNWFYGFILRIDSLDWFYRFIQFNTNSKMYS